VNDDFLMMYLETYDQFEINQKIIGTSTKFLKEGCEGILIYFFDERIVKVDIPPIVELEVTSIAQCFTVETDTRDDGRVLVELETGASILVPKDVTRGDRILVDTRLGQFVEKVGD
jgi:elongation factor P